VSQGRVPGLDGVRGIAILLVLVSHGLGFLGAGIAGVLLFFVLSGFLITSLLLREHRHTGGISLSQFYLRRAVRLLPALVAFLAVLFLVSLFPWSGTSPAEVARGGVYAITYTTNLVVGFGIDLVPTTEHLWTLAGEEQFYVLWPLIAIVLLRKVPPSSLVTVVLRLYAASILLRVVTVVVSVKADWFFYVLPTIWGDSLMAGCLLAVLVRDRPALVQRFSAVLLSRWAGALGALVIVVFALNPSSYWSPVTYVATIPLLCLVGWQLLLGATTAAAPLCRTVLSWPGLQWFGLHSYALYLYNSAAVLVVTAALGRTPLAVALGIIAAILLSVLSRIAVEQPAQAWRRRREAEVAPRASPRP
jgi:peptidoglycan/LPS O-acetylase OafA/YrhL